MVCRSRFIEDPNLSVAERDARRQVHGLRSFYHHLLVFAVINSGLAAINLIVSPARLWFYWPLLGWGGVAGAACLCRLRTRPLAGRRVGGTKGSATAGRQERGIIGRCLPCLPRWPSTH